MHSSSLKLGRKGVDLNVCESFKYFSEKLLRKYLKKKIFVFQKSNFTMKGASVKVAISSFFLNSLRNPTTRKISFHWGPHLAFPIIRRNICKSCFLNNSCNSFLKNRGHNPVEGKFLLTMYLFLLRNENLLRIQLKLNTALLSTFRVSVRSSQAWHLTFLTYIKA